MGRIVRASLPMVLAAALALVAAARAQDSGPAFGPPTMPDAGVTPEALPSPPPLPPTPPVFESQPGLATEAAAAISPWAPPLALERLPDIAPDPPVPYYTALQGATQAEPCGAILENPGYKTGWMASAEASFLLPFVHNGLNSGPGAVPGIPGNVQVPQARSGGAVSPRIDIGYRFAEGLGEVHLAYRNLNSDTTRTIDNFDPAGAGQVTSRLSLNVLDLDYGFPELNPGRVPRASPLLMIPGRLGLGLHPENVPPSPLGIKYFAGVRVANAFFDSQGTGAQILNARVSNNFVGAGPRLGVELNKPLGGSPWSLFGRFEVSGLLGKTNQTFSQTDGPALGGPASGTASISNLSLGVPVIDGSAGVRYVPQFGQQRWRISAGYLYEQWFYLGETSTSNAGITLSGGFLRAEFGF